ncbi:LANO_0B07140g1_1 [Lachancea nothofagi CBS 11611]|uniref:LANO_0B07140g1_1 n=1 Tax=Lachancea nothofagi CBS 11611 TaxID=1266666 RepID=A0A1G4IZG8_9SACH|nr:LANO_0B07140g1_1 [Lachancea nothofagi CBS 11611]
MNTKSHVVVIGGSFAGIKATEVILSTNKDVQVTMISASSHAYFNVAAPRALVEPKIAEQLFYPVKDKLKKLAPGKASFILGTVKDIKFEDNTVVYEESAGVEHSVAYDYLVVASGTKSHSAAFKLEGDYHLTKDAVLDLHAKIKNAENIIIIGGGATAVEVAGELGETYGTKKKISLYAGSSGPLKSWLPKVSDAATKQLESLNITVVNNVKYSSMEDAEDGKTKVIFDNGESQIVDLAIPAFGVIPNSDFIDVKFLDGQGYLVVDENLTVKQYPNVLGFGDIVSGRPCTIVDLEQIQVSTFQSTVKSVIFGDNGKKKPLKKSPELGLVPVSRNGGVGVLFGWRVPSFLVRFIKSKDFMVSRGAKSFA